MSILVIVAIAGVALLLGGRFYAPVIARVLGEQAARPTPAAAINDGRDYVPTRTPIVFAHHYASIAGAGPIVGPVIALYYGWLPALLWIVLGGIFLGAVHDFVATHIAVREGGKNIAVVARRYLGPQAFMMMLVMLVALLVLVCAAFLDLSAQALTSKVSIQTLELPTDQQMFRTAPGVFFESPDAPAAGHDAALLAVLRADFAKRKRPLSDAATLVAGAAANSWTLADNGREYPVTVGDGRIVVKEEQAVIGGIASTSVVVITAFSPLIGFLYLKRKTPVWVCSLLAIVICGVSILIGLWWPMSVEPLTWKLMISGYVLISAGLPVWLFLQSRDFINVHILYVGIVFLIIALVLAGISGGGVFMSDSGIPATNIVEGSKALGPMWPVLFVIIACGAVSGFHSLCAGGTTCKQLRSEPAARHVGYYAMLLESFLAVCVVSCLVVGLSKLAYVQYCHVEKNAVLTFAMSVGKTASAGMGLSVAFGALGAMLLLEGFLVTTLDTAIRLTRYMIEEGWATFFREFDVFAGASGIDAASPAGATSRGALEMTGAGGMPVDKPRLSDTPLGKPIRTTGVRRLLLTTLQHYWINSGIAVALMLLLGLGSGYGVIWKIFGSANQLLGALTLVIATCWLAVRLRPVWYTALPAAFMLLTSLGMLTREIFTTYNPWAADGGKPMLFVTAIIVEAMTFGVLAVVYNRFIRAPQGAAVPGGPPQ